VGTLLGCGCWCVKGERCDVRDFGRAGCVCLGALSGCDCWRGGFGVGVWLLVCEKGERCDVRGFGREEVLVWEPCRGVVVCV